MKNVVTIGGGTGTFVVLSALKDLPVRLTAIVAMADDGGSTGILRDDYGVLPPGDIRRALVALSESSNTMRDLFNYRFEGGGLHGHSFGNLFLSALEKVTGNFEAALEEASSVLNVKGRVVPATLDNVRLMAKLTNGKIIRGETNIDIPKVANRAHIENVWLKPDAYINPVAKKAMREADLIILGPGDIYTSIVPNLLVHGVREELNRSKARKVYVCNLMTKESETHGFEAEDFVRAIKKYMGGGSLDYALFNKKKPSSRIINRYKHERSEYVKPPIAKSSDGIRYVRADLLYTGSDKLIRHDSRRLAKALMSLLR